jgi:adenylylsulfate kinase
MIYYFIGQPGSGKTTLAKILERELDVKISLIDGDDLRRLYNHNDYSEAGRRKNIERAQDIARFVHETECDVIIAMVSPYKDLRDEFKKQNRVIEIYVHTSKIRGREEYFVENYEPPTENYCDLDTTEDTPLESIEKLFDYIDLQS